MRGFSASVGNLKPKLCNTLLAALISGAIAAIVCTFLVVAGTCVVTARLSSIDEFMMSLSINFCLRVLDSKERNSCELERVANES